MIEFNGYKIYAVDLGQKLKISDSFEYISDESRQEINQYLAATFGYRNLFEDSKVIVDEVRRAIYVSHAVYDSIEKEIKSKSRQNGMFI